jgi:hypothetical protein
MPLLYFDNNIISYLHHPEDYIKSPWYRSLEIIQGYLDNRSSDVTVVYSPAHLMDVRRGLEKSEQQTADKLDFISKLTKSCCLVKNIVSNEVRMEQHDAFQFFSRGSDSLEDFLQSGGKGIKLLKIVEESPNFQKYKDLPIDFSALSNTLAVLPIAFPRTKITPTVYSLMCDFAEFFNELSTNGHLIYKMLREKARSDTGIGPTLANNHDPLMALHMLLQKSETGRLIDRVMKESFLSDAHNRQEIVGSLFMNLDLFGFKSDKLNSQHGFTSVSTDADHSYYASYCDIFVTQDEKTAKKCEAVYKYLHLDTYVADIDKLAERIGGKSLK